MQYIPQRNLEIMLDMHVKKKSRVKKDAYINEFTLIM